MKEKKYFENGMKNSFSDATWNGVIMGRGAREK